MATSFLFFVDTILLGLSQLLNADDNVIITTALGDIKGSILHDNSAPTVYQFLGIQYGIAPIGALRFRPAQLNTSWNTSTYDATSYGPMCIQPYTSNIRMSENCLYLNIWTPKTAIDNENDLLPVMLWIHGGSMFVGSGSDPSYNASNFVAKSGNVVFVTINYRLGPLGLFASQQLFSEDPTWKSYGGMNAIYDQIQSIKWVKQFISGFGGDPNQITITGESAGGESICYLLLSPIVPHNLFQRALIESGACIGPWGGIDLQKGLQSTEYLCKQYGLSTNLTVLRSYSADKFKVNSPWSTSVDNLVLTELPAYSYANLDNKSVTFNAKELIMGFNSMDGIVEGDSPNNEQEYNQFLHKYIKNETQVNLMETVYYPLSDYQQTKNGNSAAFNAWATINGDVCVACPTIRIMRQIVNELNSVKTYVYEFRGAKSPYYAYHGSEISFVFDHPTINGWDQTLSDQMVSAWSNYGAYGVPNMTNDQNNVINWEPFTSDNQNVVIFDDKTRNEGNYTYTFRHNACDFWYQEVGYDVMANICCGTCLYE